MLGHRDWPIWPMTVSLPCVRCTTPILLTVPAPSPVPPDEELVVLARVTWGMLFGPPVCKECQVAEYQRAH